MSKVTHTKAHEHVKPNLYVSDQISVPDVEAVIQASTALNSPINKETDFARDDARPDY